MINELSRDSRLPCTALARRLGVGRPLIRQTLKRLLGEDVVALELAVNYAKLGLQTIAFIGLNVRLDAIDAVLNRLAKSANISFIGVTAGRYNILLWSIFESAAELASFVEHELAAIDGILRSETFINVKVIKRSWDDLLNSVPLTKSIDTLDRRIISVLQREPRIPYAKLASRLNMTVPTARQRVGRLVREGVIGFSLSCNPLKLGYHAVTDIGVHVQPAKLQEVQRSLEQMPEVRFIALTAGRYDFIVVTRFVTHDDLLAFIQNDLASIRGIEQVETFIVLRVVKRSFNESFHGFTQRRP